MTDPVVSVVLTVFNGEAYVADTIRSVLSQTYTDFEFLIVDDCSTDRSPEIIRQFDDPRIIVRRTERNSHVAGAHNFANRLVRGKYIACIDKDDLWKPEKLELQVRYMENHPETGACFTQLDFIDENGVPFQDEKLSRLFDVKNKDRYQWVHELLTTGNHLANDSSMIRTDIMKAIGENNLCLVQLHDYDMWVKIPTISDIYLIETPLMSYRKFHGSGSITDRTRSNNLRSDFEFAWIIANLVLAMEPELFRKVFHAEMIHPDTQDEQAILCEKAILLGSDGVLHENCRFFAFSLFDRIMRDERLRSCLYEQYHMDQHDVHQITARPIFYTSHLRDEYEKMQRTIQKQEIQISRLTDAYQKASDDIRMIQGSTSWKLTAPVRKISAVLSKALHRS